MNLQTENTLARESLNPVEHAMSGGSLGWATQAYYHIKPFLPLNFRWAIRRWRITSIMRQSVDVWPILESAATKPTGWTGWPDGKSFALVFTHDVESSHGVNNVKNLADIEIQHGFRSSFNFIPEGVYPDPVDLRSWLVANSFEVGVHDLRHDGHLYTSRKAFKRNAQRINHYLKKWQSVGFRSGFMLRQLEWLHDLDVLYDASTFDTDPFEPQPEGSRTIFPFIVRSPLGDKKSGYVELPYTLPQDSTMFLLLRERSVEIWKRKLDWVVSHGGLALVNIHPDYIDFSSKCFSKKTYSINMLLDFMAYIHSNYEGSYWNPLPKELAGWYQKSSEKY